MDASFDVAVIGAGQAGIPLALALAKAGHSVVLAEEKHLGGSCVNFGCTPTKAVIASARVAHLARRAAEFGLAIGSVDVDYPRVLARARKIVAGSVGYLEKTVSSAANLRLVRGHARFLGRGAGTFRLQVGSERLEATQVVVDTGTRSRIPPIEGLEGVPYITSETWLDRPQLPSHLLVVGGGYIGLEMGQFYRRMGSAVTVVNSGPRIAGHEDEDVAQELQGLLEREGVRFVLDAKVASLRAGKEGITARIESDRAMEIDASHVFIAAGRQPNTDALGLETVDLQATKEGTLDVDPKLSTRVPGIWAAGDVRGGPMFTHTSWDDYRILESQMIGDRSRTLDRVVPYAIFTDPELGRVGLTETQARDKGLKFRVGRFRMRDDGKAREIGETEGFIKVVVEAESGLLLGASVLAAEGSELVHEYVQLMNAKVPYSVMENAIHIHPTLSEAVQSAVATLSGG